MSYILDALRKADAQRERNPARGIHAQPLAGSASADPSRRALVKWFAVVAAAGLGALAWAGWYLYQDHEPATPAAARVAMAPPIAPAVAANVPVPPTPATAVQPPPRDPTNTSVPTMRAGPQPVVGMPAMKVGDGPPPSRFAQAAPTQGAQAPQQVPPGMAPQSPPQQTLPAPQQQATPAPQQQTMPPPQQQAAPVTQPPAPPPRPAISAPAAPPTPPVVGLPGDAPKLVISGGVYSANPAQRMLIVNGQVFNEGSEIASGVTLDEVKPKTAVLRYRGARYTIGY